MKALLLVLLASQSPLILAQNDDVRAPRQPIAFNHKLHAGTLHQPCKTCHADHDPGEMVDMPDTAQCLQCHSAIAPKTAAEEKMAAFGKQNRPIDWVRIYQLPAFVRFNHRQHAQAGVQCQVCHGSVATRVTLVQEKPITMGSCMDCHRIMRASLDCGSCHEPR